MPSHYVVTFEDVIRAHELALENGGGVAGVKDSNVIRSAIGRPYQEFTGFVPYSTVIDKAGCIMHSLLNNHGFNDGRKRTAWIVCNSFLFTECYAFQMPVEYEWYEKLAQIVNDDWNVQEIIKWVEDWVKQYPDHNALLKGIAENL